MCVSVRLCVCVCVCVCVSVCVCLCVSVCENKTREIECERERASISIWACITWAPNFAYFVVTTEGNMWGHPENIPLFPIYNRRMCHGCFKPCSSAKNHAGKRRNIEARFRPFRVEVLCKRSAELKSKKTRILTWSNYLKRGGNVHVHNFLLHLISAVADKVDGCRGIKSVVFQHLSKKAPHVSKNCKGLVPHPLARAPFAPIDSRCTAR